jgi:hypothetical protein
MHAKRRHLLEDGSMVGEPEWEGVAFIRSEEEAPVKRRGGGMERAGSRRSGAVIIAQFSRA